MLYSINATLEHNQLIGFGAERLDLGSLPSEVN
jgi:hypothetical protein